MADERQDECSDATSTIPVSRSGCCCGSCRKKRRSHKKSRNGCHNCKRRKVKVSWVEPTQGETLFESIYRPPFDIPSHTANTDPAV